MRLTFANVVAVLALGAALAGGALAAPGLVGSDGQIHACAGSKGRLTLVKQGKKCGKKQTALAWSASGRVGAPGQPGLQGEPGDRGGSNLNTVSFNKSRAENNTRGVDVLTADGMTLTAYCYTDGAQYTVTWPGHSNAGDIRYSGNEWIDNSFEPPGYNAGFYGTGKAIQNLEVDVLVSHSGSTDWVHFVLAAYRVPGKGCNFWGEVAS
jgi:hypothetical protein